MARLTAPVSKKPAFSKQIAVKPVSFNQTLDANAFERLVKYKKARGLLAEQDVVRLAVNYFLDSQGF